MKKSLVTNLSLSVTCLLGLGLAVSFSHSGNPLMVKAEDTTPVGDIYIGNHHFNSGNEADLVLDASTGLTDCTISGSATLSYDNNGFILTLDNFSYEGVYCSQYDYPGLLDARIDTSLTIICKGYNRLKLDDVYDKETIFGIALSSYTIGESPTFTIRSYDDQPAKLEVVTGKLLYESTERKDNYAFYCYGNLNFGVSGDEYGPLDITATAGDVTSTNASSISAGLYVSGSGETFNFYSGKIVATGGTLDAGRSYGLFSSGTLNIYDAEIEAYGGDTTQEGVVSSGIASDNLMPINVINGSLYSEGKTYGVYAFDDTPYDKVKPIISVKNTAQKAKFIGGTSVAGREGNNIYQFNNNIPGDAYTNIEGTEGHVSIAKKNGSDVQTINTSLKYLEFKGIIVDAPEVTYDGQEHNGVNINVFYPTSGYLIAYSTDGTNWNSTCPKHTLAGEYKTYYKVSSSEFGDVTGNKTLKIKNANLVNVSVTSKSDLLYTGSALTPEVTATGKGVDNLDATFAYSLSENNYGTMPQVTDIGEYTIFYKASLANHNDSFGSFKVNVVEKLAPTPTPTPTNNGGLPGWGIALIVVGSVILLFGLCFLVLFFLLNKWIKEGNKAVRVLKFAFGSKDGKQRYLALSCKFVYKNKEEVFNTKEDALK